MGKNFLEPKYPPILVPGSWNFLDP